MTFRKWFEILIVVPIVLSIGLAYIVFAGRMVGFPETMTDLFLFVSPGVVIVASTLVVMARLLSQIDSKADDHADWKP